MGCLGPCFEADCAEYLIEISAHSADEDMHVFISLFVGSPQTTDTVRIWRVGKMEAGSATKPCNKP